MKWKSRRQSSHIEDRRGQRSTGGFGGKTVMGGGIGLVLMLLFAFMGGDLGSILSPDILTPPATNYVGSAEEEELAAFVSVILADTEDVWTKIFQGYGKTYEKPTLVLFTGRVSSACGVAGSSTGPFYCPGDQKIYIDLQFFHELTTRFGAPGDFAMAYVVAHEVGHHVQTLLGISQQVQDLRGKISEVEYNKYLVRLELQADYLAGVFAHHVHGKGYLEPGDWEEALNAAHAIGDDHLQRQAQGYVVPDSFTHGTSAQRMHWLKQGFLHGNLDHGDTFNDPDL